MCIYTIGVYNSTKDSFFQKLKDNHIDVFLDIRRRRGVRGTKYTYVNSTALQKQLLNMGIRYEHILDLAPTLEIRKAQWLDDANNGETKKSRSVLGSLFIQRYKQQVLGCFDDQAFMNHLKVINAQNVVLFCVEENAQACHRSIVAEFLNNKYNIPYINI